MRQRSRSTFPKGSDLLVVDVTARPGIDGETLEREVAKEIDLLQADGVTDAKSSARWHSSRRISSRRCKRRRAGRQALVFATYFGDPSLLNEQVDALSRASQGRCERVQRAAARCRLTGRACFTSREKARPKRRRGDLARAAYDAVASPPRPTPGPTRDYRFPAFERLTLTNGLTVVVAPVAKLPVVTVVALVDAGAAVDPPGAEGVAQLTAHVLAEGTEQERRCGARRAVRTARHARWTRAQTGTATTIRITVTPERVPSAGAARRGDAVARAFPSARWSG
jgi:hypothetical protein